MSNFEEEYKKRLRRVVGIFDDTVEIEVRSGTEDGYWDGFCETCEYWNEGEPFVKIYARTSEDSYLTEKASFRDMGELIRALDEIEL